MKTLALILCLLLATPCTVMAWDDSIQKEDWEESKAKGDEWLEGNPSGRMQRTDVIMMAITYYLKAMLEREEVHTIRTKDPRGREYYNQLLGNNSKHDPIIEVHEKYKGSNFDKASAATYEMWRAIKEYCEGK